MPKIKFTKGELKKQREALLQYERYLPILQLKKQQLQMEIVHQRAILEERKNLEMSRKNDITKWAGLLSDPSVDMRSWLKVKEVITDIKNIAGVDIPIFDHIEFENIEYDLYVTPPWVDAAIDALGPLISIREEMAALERGVSILRDELRITTQRVNLFEKIKIPEAKEAIRRIKIYIGDQMANAVGRSKIAKRKIEYAQGQGAAV